MTAEQKRQPVLSNNVGAKQHAADDRAQQRGEGIYHVDDCVPAQDLLVRNQGGYACLHSRLISTANPVKNHQTDDHQRNDRQAV